MAKVEEIVDPTGSLPPLRVTRNARCRRRLATLRVLCGCGDPDHVVIICPQADDHDPSIEIAGVGATESQWQQLLGPVLNMVPVRTWPLYEVKQGEKSYFVTVAQAAQMSVSSDFEFVGRALDPDNSMRDITVEESVAFDALSDERAARR